MIVYHGSFLEVREPEVIKGEVGRDFGFGFYTTDIEEQAIRWARRKARIENRVRADKVMPVLNIYEWDKAHCEKNLKIKVFSGASIEWLEFVVRCRSDVSFEHEYDIVTGNIANDNVGETVSYVLQGIMRKEDAVERLKFESINNQISFRTSDALESLLFKECIELTGR